MIPLSWRPAPTSTGRRCGTRVGRRPRQQPKRPSNSTPNTSCRCASPGHDWFQAPRMHRPNRVTDPTEPATPTDGRETVTPTQRVTPGPTSFRTATPTPYAAPSAITSAAATPDARTHGTAGRQTNNDRFGGTRIPGLAGLLVRARSTRGVARHPGVGRRAADGRERTHAD